MAVKSAVARAAGIATRQSHDLQAPTAKVQVLLEKLKQDLSHIVIAAEEQSQQQQRQQQQDAMYLSQSPGSSSAVLPDWPQNLRPGCSSQSSSYQVGPGIIQGSSTSLNYWLTRSHDWSPGGMTFPRIPNSCGHSSPDSYCSAENDKNGSSNHSGNKSSSSNNASGSSMGGGNASAKSGSAAAAAPPPMDSLTAALLALTKSSRAAQLTPSAITKQLDKHIVGQAAAKRAVAVALRNRWRRHKLPASVAEEITPKNILMIGPTGCGKTEIARRLAKLVDAPFVKVEATKFTELGFVGRDVDEIVKDLMEASLTLTRARLAEGLREAAAAVVEELLLRELCGPDTSLGSYEAFRPLYRCGALDDRLVEVDLDALEELTGQGPGGSGLAGAAGAAAAAAAAAAAGQGPGGGGGGTPVSALSGFWDAMQRAARERAGGRHRGSGKTKMTIAEARKRLLEVEVERSLSSERVAKEALRAAQEDGIVFIDEIDKIVDGSRGASGATSSNVSSEGVQRDLLPILEGSVVSTKYGNVSTDHVLFIASGAFHSAKPGDMLAELQGRLPVRVELAGLTAEDFFRILTEPQHNMIRQQQVLLATEGVDLSFTEGAIRAIAKAAEQANRLLDNIGARRLHTVLERVLADISFSAPDKAAAAKRRREEAAAAAVRSRADSSSAQVMQPGVGSSQQSSSLGNVNNGGSGSSTGNQSQELFVEYEVTELMVEDCMKEILKHQDLSRYVL